jgi:hypothetical protein
MSADKFFPQRPDSKPTIYAYEDTNPQYRGLLKIGYTAVAAQSRVAQQYPTLRPGSSFPVTDCPLKRRIRRSPLCALVHFRTTWGKMRQAELRLKTNGFIQPIVIALCLMNTTMGPASLVYIGIDKHEGENSVFMILF